MKKHCSMRTREAEERVGVMVLMVLVLVGLQKARLRNQNLCPENDSHSGTENTVTHCASIPFMSPVPGPKLGPIFGRKPCC